MLSAGRTKCLRAWNLLEPSVRFHDNYQIVLLFRLFGCWHRGRQSFKTFSDQLIHPPTLLTERILSSMIKSMITLMLLLLLSEFCVKTDMFSRAERGLAVQDQKQANNSNYCAEFYQLTIYSVSFRERLLCMIISCEAGSNYFQDSGSCTDNMH